MTSNVLDKISNVVGFLPKSVDEGRDALREILKDLDGENYLEIEDIETLLELVKILNGEDNPIKINPWERQGQLVNVDEWSRIPDFRKLRTVAEENDWVVKERKLYYSFLINGRIFFRLEGLRKVKETYSCRIVIPRITDEDHLHLVLDNYNLIQFKDRKWHFVDDKKIGEFQAHGRYFLLEELHIFVKEIAKRL